MIISCWIFRTKFTRPSWPTLSLGFFRTKLRRPKEGSGPIGELSLELFVHEEVKDFSHGRPGLGPEKQKVMTGDEGFGLNFLLGKLSQFGGEESVNFKLAVAGGTVDSVQFEFLEKGGACEQAFERADAHVGSVFESHMVGDASGHGRNFLVGEAQAAENFFRHAGTNPFVAKEANAAVGVSFGGARFADVMEKGGEGEDGRRFFQVGEKQARVDPNIAFGVIIGGLGAAAHFEEFRKPEGGEPRGVEKIKAASGIGAGENFGEFVADTLGRDDPRGWSELDEGLPSGGLNLEI